MAYTEADTRAKLIDPQIKSSQWLESNIVREYYFTDGRKLIGGKRGKRYFVDYLLVYKNTNLAIVEAKAQNHDPLDGLQQAIDYAMKLKVDFVYATNGDKIYEHDLTLGKGCWVESFPTPQELFERKFPTITPTKEKLVKQAFHFEGNMKPRYYQQIAVDKTLEAIADDKDRILLTLATGTGKTYIAFQIVYRLFEAKWTKSGNNRRPKVLFLADRNVLSDQALNTFNPLEKEIVKINGKEIRKRNGKVPTNANIFFAIYQAIAERKSGEYDEEDDVTAYYKEYPSEFFDLVIIDECHRGSANDKSSWRDILNHFKSAVHLGLTATPKRDDNGDTYDYFGKAVYEYSLKDGINDGFLTPYKVKRVQTNIDEYRFNPNDIIQGELEEQIDEVQLEELKTIFQAQDSDIYDVIAHLSFNLDIKTRGERAYAVYDRKYIEKYHNDKVKEFLSFILERYKKDGVKEIGSNKLSSLIKLSGIDRGELKEAFAGAVNIREGYLGLQREIYR